eukprot:TRINITY_DN8610_c0_g1_i1.p1 TRINITY_DN8610_c0_g1~~TRINITY_DN8610_c0_g1_i1.p1  ORF type:complete len:329 (+),score=29.47 TRINITY_DN8610_c0_g1_i1:95-1081(+)
MATSLRIFVVREARLLLFLGLVGLAVSWAPVWFSPIVLAAGVLAVVAGSLGQHHYSSEERYYRNDCCCMPLSSLTHYFNMQFAGCVLALIAAVSSIVSAFIWKRSYDCAKVNCNGSTDPTDSDSAAIATYQMFLQAAVVSFVTQILLFLTFLAGALHSFRLRQEAYADTGFAEVQVPGWVHAHQIVPFPVPVQGVHYGGGGGVNGEQGLAIGVPAMGQVYGYSGPVVGLPANGRSASSPGGGVAVPVLQLASSPPPAHMVATATHPCSFCNAPFPQSAHYCSVCGASRPVANAEQAQLPRPPNNFCSSCGVALQGLPRCPNCGTRPAA